MDTPCRLEGLSLPMIIQFRTGEEILCLSEGISRSELDRASIELICSRT
jgi:hypothetical protein